MCDERERLITQIKPPRASDVPVDLTNETTGYHFGPFPVGALIRIKAGIGDIWFCAQGSKKNIATRANGAFLAAGTFDDYEITTAEERYISCVMDSDSTAAYATVWMTNRVQQDLNPT